MQYFAISWATKKFIFFKLFVRFWHQVDRAKKIQFGMLIILMILASVAEVMSIGSIIPFLGALVSPEKLDEYALSKYLIEHSGISDAKQVVFLLTLIFILLCILAGFLRLSLTWAQTRLSYGLGAFVSIKIYEHSLYQSYATHISRNSSEIISGVTNKVNILVGNFINPVITLITSTVMLVIIFFVLILINPNAAIASGLGFGLIYFLVAKFTRKQLSQDGEKINHEQTKVFKTLQEGLGGIRDILLDGTQLIYVERYKKSEISLRRSLANVQIIASSPRFIIEMLGMILIACIAFYMINSGDNIQTVLPILGALALGAQRMLPMLQQIYYSWSSLKGGEAVILDVINLLEQPIRDHQFSKHDSKLVFNKHIKFSEIYFSYTGSHPWVLENLSLNIPKGSRIGIIGSTGCGKTTYLDILMGLLAPTHGEIYIDSKLVKLKNNRSWQERIAHVPQSIFLSDTTILENIAFGIPKDKINLSRVKTAAKIAQLESAIEAWPNKYETRVGERGMQLSGGQRQRIGIARAMYKDSDIIIFDEATSALDNDTESTIMQAIDSLPRHLTTIIVAHRLTTLKNCTLIVELSEGKVKRIGSFSEIIGN